MTTNIDNNNENFGVSDLSCHFVPETADGKQNDFAAKGFVCFEMYPNLKKIYTLCEIQLLIQHYNICFFFVYEYIKI